MKNVLLAFLLIGVAPTWAATPAELLAGYTAQVGQPADAQRGQQFFQNKHGQSWSCATCHGQTPLTPGRHVSTQKTIKPLAPAANPRRFTQASKVEKWFRRNCNDVLDRACTPAEKADVLAWLITLR